MFENEVYDALDKWSRSKEQRERKMSVHTQKDTIEGESKCSHVKGYMKRTSALERVQ